MLTLECMLGHQSLGVCVSFRSMPTTLFEILGETHFLISCGCLLLFTNIVNLEGGKLDDCIDIRAISCSVQLLFTHKINCLQTIEHMSTRWAIKA